MAAKLSDQAASEQFRRTCVDILEQYATSTNCPKEDYGVCRDTIRRLLPDYQDKAPAAHYRHIFSWPHETRWRLERTIKIALEPYEHFKKDYQRLWNIIDMRFDFQTFDYGDDADRVDIFPKLLDRETAQLAGLRDQRQSESVHRPTVRRIFDAVVGDLEEALSDESIGLGHRVTIRDVLQRLALWLDDVRGSDEVDLAWRLMASDPMSNRILSLRLGILSEEVKEYVNHIRTKRVSSTLRGKIRTPLRGENPRQGISLYLQQKHSLSVQHFNDDAIRDESPLSLVDLPRDITQIFRAGVADRLGLCIGEWSLIDSGGTIQGSGELLDQSIFNLQELDRDFRDEMTSPATSEVLGALFRVPQARNAPASKIGHIGAKRWSPFHYSLTEFTLTAETAASFKVMFRSPGISVRNRMFPSLKVIGADPLRTFNGSLSHLLCSRSPVREENTGSSRTSRIVVRVLSNHERILECFRGEGLETSHTKEYMLIGLMCVVRPRIRVSAVVGLLLKQISGTPSDLGLPNLSLTDAETVEDQSISQMIQIDLNKQMIDAVWAGDLEQVRRVHKIGGQINSYFDPEGGRTALRLATEFYNLRKERQPNYQQDSMPSMDDGVRKYAEVIRYLVEHGADQQRESTSTSSLIREALRELEKYENRLNSTAEAGQNLGPSQPASPKSHKDKSHTFMDDDDDDDDGYPRRESRFEFPPDLYMLERPEVGGKPSTPEKH